MRMRAAGRSVPAAGEPYAITAIDVAAGTYSVLCDGLPCTAWKHASLNVTDFANGAVAVLFDSGVLHTGTVSQPLLATITWTQDGSVWERPTPGNWSFNVHFIQHRCVPGCAG